MLRSATPCAPVAQRLERTAHNGLVAGSIPARRTKAPVYVLQPATFNGQTAVDAVAEGGVARAGGDFYTESNRCRGQTRWPHTNMSML